MPSFRKSKALKTFTAFIISCISSVSALISQQPQEASVPQGIPIYRNHLPVINKLKYKDEVFKQYTEDVERSYRDIARQRPPLQLFYSYTTEEGENIFTVSARCNIPFETISTLNRIQNPDSKLQGKQLLLPTAAGIFIPVSLTNEERLKESPLETLLQKNHMETLENSDFYCYNMDGRLYVYLPGQRFSGTERAFFLDTSIKIPVKYYRLTSPFGKRENPFDGTKNQFHKGIDMAAPEGTDVYACKSGTVKECGEGNPTYGNYILVQHTNGMTSFYAHLSQVFVKREDSVQGGQIIGKVGRTGKVTGSHLHFEIRLNGKAKNPKDFLKE